jgi:hypothetical protein
MRVYAYCVYFTFCMSQPQSTAKKTRIISQMMSREPLTDELLYGSMATHAQWSQYETHTFSTDIRVVDASVADPEDFCPDLDLDPDLNPSS